MVQRRVVDLWRQSASRRAWTRVARPPPSACTYPFGGGRPIVFFDRIGVVHAARQRALDAAYALHPERFPNGAPKAALPPAEVNINPLEVLAVTVNDGPSGGAANIPVASPDLASENTPHAAAKTPRREALAAAAMAFAT